MSMRVGASLSFGVTTAAPRVESTGASIFAGASSTSFLGGEVSNSQRDQNKATIIIHVGGSDSDSSRATSAASKTRTSGLVRDSPDASTSSASDEEGSILEKSSVSTDSGLGNSETSFEIESPSTEEEDALEEEPSNAIYQRHMCLKKHGFPLWIPQPSMTLPHSYQRQGVSIGDVGIFTSDGGFDFLFNVCLPAGHPSNPDELPEGFSCLDLKPADVCKVRAHSSHSYMSSPSVQKQGSMTFECSGSDGSILTMPQGAYHEDLRNIRRFRDYAFIHAESWYQYANGPCGREIGNAELHLVTGCDKATSWGIATYSHRQSKRVEDNATRLSFNISNEGRHLYPTFTWDHEQGDAEVKAGPEHEELMDPPEVHALTPLRNQCTFVRSLTPAFSDNEWERLQSKVAVSEGSEASLGLPPKNPSLSVLGPTNSLPGRIGPGHSQMGTSRLIDSLTPAQTLAAHPATFVIDMLLQKCPKAKVVAVHDSDWCSVIRDSDNDWMSIYQDLQGRIQEAFDVVEEEKGTIYLQEKAGSSQQPNTSSPVSVKLKEENFALLAGPGFSQLFDSFKISPSDVKADSPDTSEAPHKSRARWNGAPYFWKSPFQVMSQQSKKGKLSKLHLPHPIHPTKNLGPVLQPDDLKTSSLWARSDPNDEAPPLNKFLNPFAPNGRSVETQPRGHLFSGNVHSPLNGTTAYLDPKNSKIHPLLRVSNTPHIIYDVSYHPSTLQLRNPSIPLQVLAEPATESLLSSISLTSPHLLWYLRVFGKNSSYVTVADLLEGIYHALRLNVTQAEYGLLPTKAKLGVNTSYERRYNRLWDWEDRERERAGGFKRVDFLGRRGTFLGLSSTQKGADVWQLNVS